MLKASIAPAGSFKDFNRVRNDLSLRRKYPDIIYNMTIPASNLGTPLAMLPAVSVCIGCFNQADFIETAIRSVATQTYAAFDCVIVDDSSSDDSCKRIEACLAELSDDRFRFLPCRKNGGQMTTLMTGLDATDAPLVAFLDGDDAWHANFLECHVSAHLSRAGIAALSSSDEILIDKAGTILSGGHPSFRQGDPRRTGARDRILRIEGEAEKTLVFVDRGVTGWLWSTTSGMMFRRDALEVMRPVDSGQIRICADTYLAHGAHMLGGTIRLERVLGSYRLHAANGWAKCNLIGAGSQIGCVSPETTERIRAALVERWCAVAPVLEPIIPRRSLRRTLVEYIGWAAAFDLVDTNEQCRFLLKDWATPIRKRFFKIVSALPQALRPRFLR